MYLVRVGVEGESSKTREARARRARGAKRALFHDYSIVLQWTFTAALTRTANHQSKQTVRPCYTPTAATTTVRGGTNNVLQK